MDLRSGCPFWPIRDGLPGAYPALAADADCEIAVIGGGVSGALVAHALVDAGIATLLLDKRDFGWGSTSATTALVQYEIDTPLQEMADAMGEERAVACYRAAFGAIGMLERLAGTLDQKCGFSRRPSLYLASRAAHRRGFEREHEIRTRHGFDVELWDRRRIAACLPFEREAALFSRDAAELDPYRLAHALIATATRRGLRAHDRTEVARPRPSRRVCHRL